MARFVLATGVQPSEYRQLTSKEYIAFVSEVNRRDK
jgi:hypothetical protein